jgi:DNA-binding transcriptional MocR family regulator
MKHRQAHERGMAVSQGADMQRRPAWLKPLVAGSGPRYLQIADLIAHAVRNGELKAGDQVPPQRWLATELGVDLTTVTRAYAEARVRGLLASFGGRGSFIAEPYDPSQRGMVDLAMNIPPQPANRALADHIKAGMSEVVTRHDAESVSGYHHPVLEPTALQAARTWLGPMLDAMGQSQVLMCAGTQGAIFNLLQAHTRRGDAVLCDPLTYPGFLRAARALGLKIIGVPGDASGMLPDALERSCRDTGAGLLYLNPTIQNPTASTMPTARRQDIAAVLRKSKVTLIEDDPYRHLLNDAPLPISACTSGERSYYLASLSKCLSPSLRAAYVVAPSGQATTTLLESFAATSMGCSALLAGLVQTWIVNGTAKSLLGEIQLEARSRQALARSILPGSIQAHPSGIHLWLPLPPQWRPTAFSQALEDMGVRIAATNAFGVEDELPSGVRISVGGARSHAELSAALQKIQTLLGKSQIASSRMVV